MRTSASYKQSSLRFCLSSMNISSRSVYIVIKITATMIVILLFADVFLMGMIATRKHINPLHAADLTISFTRSFTINPVKNSEHKKQPSRIS